MATALNDGIHRAASLALISKKRGRTGQPGNGKKAGLLKGSHRAMQHAINSLTVALRHGAAPIIGHKARAAVEAEGVDIPLAYDEGLISQALHTLMTKKKTATKAIRAEFYTTQRRDIGWYTSTLIKAGYGDTKTFWSKLLEQNHKPHVFWEVKVGSRYSSKLDTIKRAFLEWWGKQFAAVPDNVGLQLWKSGMDQVDVASNKQLVRAISEAEVAKTIHSFKDTTPGTDQITAGMLKELHPAPHSDIQSLPGRRRPARGVEGSGYYTFAQGR
jgi:hypothetical protein